MQRPLWVRWLENQPEPAPLIDAPAARTKPRLKKVKVERTGPLRRSTREGIKKKKGFYSQRAMELEAWKGTGTKDDPYDAR